MERTPPQQIARARDYWEDLSLSSGGLPSMLITERTAESMTVFMRSIADAELFIDDLKANFAGGAFQADLESNALLVSDSRAAGVRGVKVTVASSDSTRLDSEIVGFIRSRSAY